MILIGDHGQSAQIRPDFEHKSRLISNHRAKALAILESSVIILSVKQRNKTTNNKGNNRRIKATRDGPDEKQLNNIR
jgi:hypothetical protein